MVEITDLTQVRWLAGFKNHTNGLHYAPYTLPFSFPKPQSHNLTRPAILIRRLKHSLPTTFYDQSIPILLSINSSPDSNSRSSNANVISCNLALEVWSVWSATTADWAPPPVRSQVRKTLWEQRARGRWLYTRPLRTMTRMPMQRLGLRSGL